MTAAIASPKTSGAFTRWFPRVLVVLLALHFARGVLPFAPVEGDEQGVINGVQAWMRGSADFDAASYLYPIQSGSYHLIWCVQRITGASSLQVFGTLSALGTAGFLSFASFLLARAAAVRPAWTAVALLTLHELTTTAFYANTNALAAGFTMAGLLVAQRARNRPVILLGGLLLGIGGWMRLDSLMLSPLFLLLRLKATTPARAFWETVQAAAISVALLWSVWTIIGLPLQAIASAAGSRSTISTRWQMLAVQGWLVLGYVATAFCFAGIIRAIFRRRWLELSLLAPGLIVSLAVYGSNFTTPKYFYYIAPFLLLPGLVWLAELLETQGPARRWSRALAFGVIGLHGMEILVGPQTSSADFRRYDAAPPQLALGQIAIRSKVVRLGLGEGEVLPTDDGPRLRGGQFWEAGMWRREKRAMLEEIARLDAVMQAGDTDVIITSTYLSGRVLESWLRDHGFVAAPRRPFPRNASSYLEEWHRGDRHLTLAQINHTDDDAGEFATVSQLPGRILVVTDRGRNAFLHLSTGTGEWQSLSPSENHLITLYRPRTNAASSR